MSTLDSGDARDRGGGGLDLALVLDVAQALLVERTHFFASSWRCRSTGSFSRTIAVPTVDRHVLA